MSNPWIVSIVGGIVGSLIAAGIIGLIGRRPSVRLVFHLSKKDLAGRVLLFLLGNAFGGWAVFYSGMFASGFDNGLGILFAIILVALEIMFFSDVFLHTQLIHRLIEFFKEQSDNG